MQEVIDRVIPFIKAQQESNGSFPTYESYPVVNPAAGWTKLPDPSPFITANILFSLIQLSDPRLKSVIEKGAQNLLTSKEGKGFWRFWPVKSRQHTLPLDMDDTSIVSAVLDRCGYNIDNEMILLANQNANGRFETWLRPRITNVVISPSTAYGFFKDYLLARPTQKLKYFSYQDYEPAIEANALLYLGEGAGTDECVNHIMDEVESAAIPKKFYDDDVVVYFHISRAYVNGIKSFKKVGPVIAKRIWDRFDKSSNRENDLMMAMAANILLDYGVEIELAGKLLVSITEGTSYPDKWITHPYFCSNDKNFLAGSPALTAAVFMEACCKFTRNRAI